jgi:isochorismate hydrolase
MGGMAADDSTTQIHPARAPHPGDVTVTKRRVSAVCGSDLDDDLTVLRDGCADADTEVHRVLLDKVFPRQAAVVNIDEWVTGLAATSDSAA